VGLGGIIEGFHEIQNQVNDRFIPDAGIDHGVIHTAVRPCHPEIFLDEIGALPIDRAVRHIRTLDWRPVRPGWLRELAKRWARNKLRNGISLVHVTAVRLATVRFGEFLRTARLAA